MCLGIPGKILSINEGDDALSRTGKVSFGGAVKEAGLAFVPEAKVGEYVIVHAGFALSVVDEEEAQKILDDLKAISDLSVADEQGRRV